MKTSKLKTLPPQAKIKKKEAAGQLKEERASIAITDENGFKEEYVYDEYEGTWVKKQRLGDDRLDRSEEEMKP